MLIRCEKCSTTYELEERLVPPGGAPVQCSRCEHVFRAYPPSRAQGDQAARAGNQDRRPGLELVPPPPDDLPRDAAEPAAEEPGPPAPELDAFGAEPAVPAAEPPEPAPAWLPPVAQPAAPLSEEQRPVATAGQPAPDSPVGGRRISEANAAARPERGSIAEPRRTPTDAPGTPGAPATYKPPPGPVIPPGKPVRKVPNPELEGTDVPSFAPSPRRGMTVDVGTRRRGKSSWVVWAAVGLLALLTVAGTISWWQDQRAAKAAASAAAARAAAPSRAGSRERQDAVKLLLRDDAASVERAAAALDAAVRREPASGARADRALALALLSQQARDQADRQEGRARVLDEERAKAAAAPDGASRAAELTSDAEAARAEVEPLRERAGRLLAEARGELEAMPRELSGDASTVRARAWVQLASGDRPSAGKTAHGGSADDPWIALASVLADLPENAGGDAQQGAAERLEQLAASHPEFVRPLFLAARLRALLGDGERAVRDLDGVLRLNPQHLEARRLRAEIAPAIPDAAPAGGDAAAPAGQDERGTPTQPSPGVNGRSQRGNGAAPAQGR